MWGDKSCSIMKYRMLENNCEEHARIEMGQGNFLIVVRLSHSCPHSMLCLYLAISCTVFHVLHYIHCFFRKNLSFHNGFGFPIIGSHGNQYSY